MDIVYHSTDSFAEVTGVSMVSLFENNRWADDITVYYFENNISEKHKNELLNIAMKYDRKLVFIPMPDIEKDLNLKVKKLSKWNNDSYCRLFFDVILPDTVDRLLYLDCDTIIVGSLEQLWHMDMKGHSLAAVADCLGKEYYKVLNLPKDATYCNDGVLLFSLRAWKEKKLGDKARKFIKDRNGYVFFVEQTVFPAVCYDEMLILPPQYNTYTMMLVPYKEVEKIRHPVRYYTKNEIEYAVHNPIIVHLTGSFLIKNRAWHMNNTHPFKNEYLKYYRLTPWGESALIEKKLNIKEKIINLIINYVPKIIWVPIVSLIYNKFRIMFIQKDILKNT